VRTIVGPFAVYAAAALCEIGGCYAWWCWRRAGAGAWVLLPGMACLALFGWLLTLVDSDTAGRIFAAYGGIYIVGAIAWLRLVEGRPVTMRDLAGVALCLAGAAVILSAGRAAGR
jgi:small multidrug resistance family-3 protein